MCRQWFAFQSLFSGLWGPSGNYPWSSSIFDLYQWFAKLFVVLPTQRNLLLYAFSSMCTISYRLFLRSDTRRSSLFIVHLHSWWSLIVVNSFALCKGNQDSLGFWIPCRGLRIPDTGFQSLTVELGFWIPIFSGIPDSMSCIPDSKANDIHIPQAKFTRIPDSTGKNYWDCGIRFPLHGAEQFLKEWFKRVIAKNITA